MKTEMPLCASRNKTCLIQSDLKKKKKVIEVAK